ncbi:MAG TPA: tyrosine-type recombinase/integrase [Candidatus Woesebacteria bacterium]|nr:tyrosine-type recombinase/integrase [Candidatus Woesebacteria bacterium]
MTNELQLLTIDFLEHLEIEKNLSPLTVRNYRHYLQRFCDWCVAQGCSKLNQISADLLRKYRVYLNRFTTPSGDTLAKSTQAYHVIAIRSWFKWLVKNDYQVLHPEKIDLPKGEPTSMQFLNLENVERLLSQPLVSSEIGLRDRAILEVLFATGLRVSELVSLDRDQIDFDRLEFSVIGKGRKVRMIFLSDQAAIWLSRYLRQRKDHWQPVFIRYSRHRAEITDDGNSMRLTTRSVQRLVEKYARRARLSIKITPHGLRHSFATDLLNNGAGLRDVQELLGHKSIATTQIYTHVTHPKLKQVHQEYHSDLRTNKSLPKT